AWETNAVRLTPEAVAARRTLQQPSFFGQRAASIEDRQLGRHFAPGQFNTKEPVMEFALQLAIILACLFYGARKGGIALGLLGGIGIVILVFGFKLPPGK